MMQMIRYSDPFRSLMRDFLKDEVRVQGWAPALDIAETDDAYFVTAELPGVDPTTVELSLEDGVLEVKGEKAIQKPEGTSWHRTERRAGEFARQIRLPNHVDAESIEAESKHGLLVVKLPKRAEAKPRKIDVRVG